jgi:hypothetical protein
MGADFFKPCAKLNRQRGTAPLYQKGDQGANPSIIARAERPEKEAARLRMQADELLSEKTKGPKP